MVAACFCMKRSKMMQASRHILAPRAVDWISCRSCEGIRAQVSRGSLAELYYPTTPVCCSATPPANS